MVDEPRQSPAGMDTLDAALARPDQADGASRADREADGSDSAPKAGSRRRRLLIPIVALIVLLLVAGGLLASYLTRSSATASRTTTRTVTVSSQTIKQTVSATGTLDPAEQADLSFSSNGTVDAVDVAVGDSVTRGESLISIDDASLKVAVTSARAAVTDAESTLATDQDDADGTDSSDAAIAADKANLALKKSQLAQAGDALDAATLTAPFAGKVAAINVSKGDSVSGGSSSNSSGSGTSGSGAGGSGSGSSTTGSSTSSAVTVISSGTFTVDTSVSNSDVTSVKKGMQATITPTGSTTAVFGTVSSVGVVASSSSSSTDSGSSGSATFPVTIKVTGTHTDLLPGSAVGVAITVQQLSDAITVPTAAITTTNGKTTVDKMINGTAKPTAITIGQTLGTLTQVTGGLSAGDQIQVSFRAAGAARAGGNASSGTGGGYGFGSGAAGFGGTGTGQGGPPGQDTGQGAPGQNGGS